MRRIAALLALAFAPGTLVANDSPPPAAFRIAGAVVDSVSGQPLDGAEVTIASVSDLEQTQTFLTSADGRFVFAGLSPGKYRLTAGRRGYANQGFHQHEGFMTAIVTGPGLDSEHIRFPLSPNAVLTGVVTDEWGDPVREGKVLLFQQNMFEGSQTLRITSQTTTDDQGRYRFAHLLSGTYAVAVYARPWFTQDALAVQLQMVDNLRSAVSSAAITQSSQDSAIVSSQTLNTLQSGLPPDSQAALESLQESVASVSDGILQPSLGQLFDVVYPVTYFPNATHLADAARLSLAAGATETADFQLHAVPSVHLRVSVPLLPPVTVISTDTDAQQTTSEVDAPADVAVSLHIGEGFTDQLQPTRTEIAPGIVELSGIPPGEVNLLATPLVSSADGSYVSRAKTLELSGDAAVDFSAAADSVNVSGVVLSNQFSAVSPAPTAAGDQPSAPDQPAPDQTSLVEVPSNVALSFRSVSSGETYDASVSNQGKFSFAGAALPPGSYDVELVSQGDLRIGSIEATGATVSGHTVEIPAGQPVSLTVHTVEAKSTLSGFALKNGKPIAGAMVLLIPQDSGRGGPLYRRDQSDSDGSFSMSPLFPGRYTLLAIENGWDLEWADPAVLFRYLPGGQPIEVPPDGSVTRNAKVQ